MATRRPAASGASFRNEQSGLAVVCERTTHCCWGGKGSSSSEQCRPTEGRPSVAEDACAGVRWAGKYGDRDRITGFVVTSRSRDGFRCSLVYFHTAHAPRLGVAHLKLDKGEVILDSAIAHIGGTATILEGMCTVNICLDTPIFLMCKITKNRLRGLL